MNTIKENSKSAFNQQAATYDKDIKGQHARSLYPILLEKRVHTKRTAKDKIIRKI